MRRMAQTVFRRSGIISFVELNLLGYKRPVGQCDLDRDNPVWRGDREGHDRRVRFKSRTGQLEICDALLELDAYRASLAVAVVVGFMDKICRGERLDPSRKATPTAAKNLRVLWRMRPNLPNPNINSRNYIIIRRISAE